MSNGKFSPQLAFDPDFLKIIINAQKESERLGINRISDILVLKILIFNSESYMSDFLSQRALDWNKIRKAIEKEVKGWADQAIKNPSPTIEAEEEDEEEDDEVLNLYFAYDEVAGVILRNSASYSYDMQTINEISFVISMLDYNSNYIVNFFNTIGLETNVPMRYYEGLMLEDSFEDFAQQLRNSQKDKEDEETDVDIEIDEGFESEVEEEQGEVEDEDKKTSIKIPAKLKSFVKVLEAEKSEKSPILGRDKETEKLTKVLLKAKKSNAILVGKAGVGKTAIVEHLAWIIENEKCAEQIKGKTILSLAVNDIVAGTIYRGMAEERFKAVADYLAGVHDVILFIDEIHNVIGAGNTGSSDNKLDMANALKPILAREGISVIGATTDKEYERIFAKDEAFKRRFEKIEIREPKPKDVYPMIKEQVNKLMKHHNILISKRVVEFIVNVSGCFVFETNNPDRTIDLVDRSMATAALKGKKTVTEEIVMSNFDANFDLFNKMTTEHKLSIAYHEVGHYLVSRERRSFQKNVIAISIVPAEDYMGVTVYDDEPNLIEWDYNDHLHNIASKLAGRVAEKMYSSKDTSGASDDLRRASEEARKMVLEYGLSNKFSRRNSEKDLSEDRTKLLNKEIDRIISEGYQLAENILKEKSELLKMIAETLTEKGMLMGKDLEKICAKYEIKKFIVKEPENSK